MIGGRVFIGVAALGLAALCGCYGSTEPATEIGPESAKLIARGTADNGPAHGGFQYWLTNADRIRKATGQAFPAGASGPSPTA